MSSIKYFLQFFIILIFFIIFKVIRLKFASNISSKIFTLIGPFFRSKRLIKENIQKAIPDLQSSELEKIISSMWSNYGRIL